MAKKVYSDLDFRKNQAISMVIHTVASFPSNAKEGQVVYHTVLKRQFICIDDTGDTTLSSAWSSSTEKETLNTFTMTSGVVTYTLSAIPLDSHKVKPFVNGVKVEFTLIGVNLTITTYSASSIETGWLLEVYYF